MKIDTTRFGEINVEDSELIKMKGHILGFGHLSRFVLLIRDENTPLWWLQSADDPSVAFVVVNPLIAKPDYNPVISGGEIGFLGIGHSADIALLAIVTVRLNPFRVTANLRAPILINAANKMASQIILDDTDYPIQYSFLDNRDDYFKGSALKDNFTGGIGKIIPMAM